jgi:hypothetical protein
MKTTLFAFILLLFACSQQPNKEIDETYGSKIDTSGSIDINEVLAAMRRHPDQNLTVKGKVSQVCQTEGCWLEMADEGGETIIVRTKSHDFTVPKDLAGKTIYLNGSAHLDTTIVEVLKHYAEDAGKSKTEIDSITKPSIDVVIEANGIAVLK